MINKAARTLSLALSTISFSHALCQWQASREYQRQILLVTKQQGNQAANNFNPKARNHVPTEEPNREWQEVKPKRARVHRQRIIQPDGSYNFTSKTLTERTITHVLHLQNIFKQLEEEGNSPVHIENSLAPTITHTATASGMNAEALYTKDDTNMCTGSPSSNRPRLRLKRKRLAQLVEELQHVQEQQADIDRKNNLNPLTANTIDVRVSSDTSEGEMTSKRPLKRLKRTT